MLYLKKDMRVHLRKLVVIYGIFMNISMITEIHFVFGILHSRMAISSQRTPI